MATRGHQNASMVMAYRRLKADSRGMGRAFGCPSPWKNLRLRAFPAVSVADRRAVLARIGPAEVTQRIVLTPDGLVATVSGTPRSHSMAALL